MLRLSGGRWRHRQLSIAASTRPSSVRLRKTLFDKLHHSPLWADWRGQLGRGSVFYDLFSGSGAVGFDMLSHWPDSRIIFFEHNAQAINILRANSAHLGVSEQCLIVRADLSKKIPLPSEKKAQTCFIDPPYDFTLPADFFQQLRKDHLVEKESLVILQTAPDKPVFDSADFDLQDCCSCGNAVLSFFRSRV